MRTIVLGTGGLGGYFGGLMARAGQDVGFVARVSICRHCGSTACA